MLLTHKDQLKIDITAKAAANLIPKKMAAAILAVSMATMFRYVQAYRKIGVLFVIHGNKGRPSPFAKPKELKEKVLNIISEKYYDFSIFHAWEKLADEKLQLMAYKTLLGWCREKKFVKRIRRRRRKQHKARARMPQRGIMLQMDGSYHQWFGKEKSCLIAAIDDADNDIPYGEFFRWETTLDCMKVIKKIIEIKGVFKILYVDKAGVFGGNKRFDFSQMQEACKRLDIQIIYAHSAEAKGRIERAWRTLQGRLIPELRLRGITEIKEANEYLLNDFLPNQYRKSFTIPPRNEKNEYVKIDCKILNEIFTVKNTRKINSDHTFSWGGVKHIIANNGNFSNAHIEVREYPEGDTRFFFRGNEVNVCLHSHYKIVA